MPEIRLKEHLLKLKGQWRKSAAPIVFRPGKTYYVDEDCFDAERMIRILRSVRDGFTDDAPVLNEYVERAILGESVTLEIVNSEEPVSEANVTETVTEAPVFINVSEPTVEAPMPDPSLTFIVETHSEPEMETNSQPTPVDIDTNPYIPLGTQEKPSPAECSDRRKHASYARSGRTCSTCGYTKESNNVDASEEERGDGDLQGHDAP